MGRCQRACPYVSDHVVLHLGLTSESDSKLAFDNFHLFTRIRTGADCVNVYGVPHRVWARKETRLCFRQRVRSLEQMGDETSN